MIIYAHRGSSGKYPENTMLAFEKAVEEGCDGIELDVQLTKDGRVVVIHDEDVMRTTGAEGAVRDYTLEELKKLDAGIVKEGAYGFQAIPSFEEYCEFAASHKIITNIEIKTGVYYYEGIEEKVVELLRRYHLEDKVLFSSFNHLSILELTRIAPEIPCGALLGKKGLGNAGYYCSKFRFKYYHPDFNSLTKEDVENCKNHGIGLNVWTVNSTEEFNRLYDWKCDGAITNYPGLCRSWLNTVEHEKMS